MSGKESVVLRSERYVGKMSRSFQLAQEIDEAQVTAKYAEGVLELSPAQESCCAGAQDHHPVGLCPPLTHPRPASRSRRGDGLLPEFPGAT
jgi:hypothetical protein